MDPQQPKIRTTKNDYQDLEWTRSIAEARAAYEQRKLMQQIEYELSLPPLPESRRMPHPSTLRRKAQ